MDPEFREAVLRRDGWRCQAFAYGFAVDVKCWGRLHVHHRELGTKRDEFDNVITLCEVHHDHAHTRDRAGAEACGIITPSR